MDPGHVVLWTLTGVNPKCRAWSNSGCGPKNKVPRILSCAAYADILRLPFTFIPNSWISTRASLALLTLWSSLLPVLWFMHLDVAQCFSTWSWFVAPSNLLYFLRLPDLPVGFFVLTLWSIICAVFTSDPHEVCLNNTLHSSLSFPSDTVSSNWKFHLLMHFTYLFPLASFYELQFCRSPLCELSLKLVLISLSFLGSLFSFSPAVTEVNMPREIWTFAKGEADSLFSTIRS